MFFRYKDTDDTRDVEHYYDVYSEHALLMMIESLNVLEFTVKEMKESRVFNDNVKEIYANILHHKEEEVDVLDEFSVVFD